MFYLFLRERDRARVGEEQREGDAESEAGSKHRVRREAQTHEHQVQTAHEGCLYFTIATHLPVKYFLSEQVSL